MNEIIIVNKEAGMTSRDVVNKISKILFVIIKYLPDNI